MVLLQVEPILDHIMDKARENGMMNVGKPHFRAVLKSLSRNLQKRKGGNHGRGGTEN